MLAAAAQIEQVVVQLDESIRALPEQVTQADKGARQASGRMMETATAMEEMHSTVLELARNSGDAATAAVYMHDKARDGHSLLQKTMDSAPECAAGKI